LTAFFVPDISKEMKNALPPPVEIAGDDKSFAEFSQEADIEARELARLIIDCYKSWKIQEDAKTTQSLLDDELIQ